LQSGQAQHINLKSKTKIGNIFHIMRRTPEKSFKIITTLTPLLLPEARVSYVWFPAHSPGALGADAVALRAAGDGSGQELLFALRIKKSGGQGRVSAAVHKVTLYSCHRVLCS
jgi:hypothetical protein